MFTQKLRLDFGECGGHLRGDLPHSLRTKCREMFDYIDYLDFEVSLKIGESKHRVKVAPKKP